jgi:hypothetical protein
LWIEPDPVDAYERERDNGHCSRCGAGLVRKKIKR